MFAYPTTFSAKFYSLVAAAAYTIIVAVIILGNP